MVERGVYQNINRGRQLLRFDGIRYDNITPTDIDAVIEYQNKCWILHEVKTKGKDVPFGQKLLFERWIKDSKKVGKHAIAIISEHEIYDTQKDIYLKRDCFVREFYSTDTMIWRPPKTPMKAVDMESAFLSFHGITKIQ